MGSTDRPWLITGGWALDLFIGHQTPPHEDTDVVTLHAHRDLIQERLHHWQIYIADPPRTLRRWLPSDTLTDRVKGLWCCEPTQVAFEAIETTAPEHPWLRSLAS